MAKIKITTKTGDKGTTGLANGERLPKSDLLFEVIGTVDELNSWLGLVAVGLDQEETTQRDWIYSIQDTLFYVGAELARSPKAKLTEKQVEKLETYNAQLEKQMTGEWHTQFVLPGGTELGAQIDIARTVCRRCERLVVKYVEAEKVSPAILKYINRLSDFLYILRCFVNQQKQYQEKKFQVAKRNGGE